VLESRAARYRQLLPLCDQIVRFRIGIGELLAFHAAVVKKLILKVILQQGRICFDGRNCGARLENARGTRNFGSYLFDSRNGSNFGRHKSSYLGTFWCRLPQGM
jgi:hypothetical protein